METTWKRKHWKRKQTYAWCGRGFGPWKDHSQRASRELGLWVATGVSTLRANCTISCWYCDARLIEDGAKLAFISVNPTGDQHDAAHDKKERYLDAPYEKRDPLWNAWLDEEWPDGNPYHPYRERVHRIFKAMCGPGWEQVLRSTACFNVCPFRTVQTRHLPPALWSSSTEWFGKALIPLLSGARSHPLSC